MLNAKDIKDNLTFKNIFKLMNYLGANPQKHNDYIIISRTICHDGHSHKLYYYDNRKLFDCYTNCGVFDVFELIQKVYDYDFEHAFKWIKSFFNISKSTYIAPKSSKPIDYVEQVKEQLKGPKIKKLKSLNPRILNSFDNIGYINWIHEGIKPKTLSKFHIKLSIPDEEIIIPEYDQDNRLIGIRCRHLDKYSLSQGRKYTPINYKGNELKYPTGDILYGLNFNKKAINHYHKVILFEAEKSVMKLDSCLGNDNFSVGLNGSNLTDQHIALLDSLNVNEIIIGLDKEFKHPYTKQERIYAEKIQSEFERLRNHYHVSVMWDTDDILNYKDSPIDDGFNKFKKLFKERMLLYEN